MLVHAKGNPAKVVAYGAAAGVAFMGVCIGYGGYKMARKAFGESSDSTEISKCTKEKKDHSYFDND
jgi:hypothetical protein